MSIPNMTEIDDVTHDKILQKLGYLKARDLKRRAINSNNASSDSENRKEAERIESLNKRYREEKMRAGLNLPAGFRFHPTDEELVMHYLVRRCASQTISVPIIREIDLYKFDPWHLPGTNQFNSQNR
ncbi:hypothetical protein QQ045_015036 [Rhodiola kirilowii]